MHNILKVYKRDLISVLTNWVALVIIIGLSCIPALYAWVNIKACWNPYENTSTIPVAIVNNDKTVTYKGKSINVGNDVVKQLKNNKKIGWKFVDSKTAKLGIADGTYYALIEIPQDFSESFLSITTDNPKKPKIFYNSYSKANPVAGKITETAKNTLVDQITSNFVTAVNETFFSAINKVGVDAEQNKKNILTLKDSIVNINNNLDNILILLQGINSRSGDLSTFMTEIKATLPAVGNGLDVINKTNENNKDIIKTSQNTLNKSMDALDLNLKNSQAAINRIQALVSNLNISSENLNNSLINSNFEKLSLQIQDISDRTSANLEFLQSINNSIPNEKVANMIGLLKNIQSNLNDEKNQLNKLQQQYISTNQINHDILNTVNSDTANLNNQMINIMSEYNNNTRTSLNAIANNLITASNDASSLISTAKGLNDQINSLMGTVIDGSNLANKVSGDLNSRLIEYRDIIKTLGDKLQQVDNNDISQIITILQSDPQFMSSFISTPFELKQDVIYGVPNYGSAMAPVYTVLSLWVGCLLLTSVLKVEPAPFEGSEKVTIREKHFGKMLTFITIALFQSLIVTVGDKLVLGVYTVNAPLMIAFSLASAICFSIITFTLVSVMDNFGKAIAIIFMILQLAGSGGTYPIQVDPLIFRILQPMFPFTYSIGGFREAIGGPIISTVFFDFTALIVISFVFLLFGFFFKEPLSGVVKRFELKFKQSGLGE